LLQGVAATQWITDPVQEALVAEEVVDVADHPTREDIAFG